MSDGGEVLPREFVPVDGDPVERGDPVHLRARARLGRTLHDKWHLDSILGVGGMATVYAATHRNGNRAAVKILHPELSLDPFVRQRFLWEGRVANAVGHEGVVRVLDDDTAQDGSLFLVTELLEGETLEQRRVRYGGRLGQREVLLVAHQLLDVLGAVHTQHIVHRDLKPENVFLTRFGRIKVLDFGIARSGLVSGASGVTQAGMTVGTPAFMAPEQARGISAEVDASSDLWACGALMFQLLSGRYVHEGRTLNEQLMHAMTRPAPRLATVASSVATPVRQLVDRALVFTKAGRWPDAAAMQDAVLQAYEELYGTPIAEAAAMAVDRDDFSRPRNIVIEGAMSTRSDVTTSPCIEASTNPSLDSPRVGSGVARPGIRTRFANLVRDRRFIAATAAAMIALTSLWFLVPSPPPQRAEASPDKLQRGSAEPAAAPRTTTTSVLRIQNLVPEVAATDLPRAAPLPSDPEPPATRRGSVPNGRTDCHPPYVVDAQNGKKRWKLECL